MQSHPQHQSDVLVIGSGAAGLTLALALPTDVRISILAKASLTEGSTLYAQGGVAAVLTEEDSIESHIEDTLVAEPDASGRRRPVPERGRALHGGAQP